MVRELTIVGRDPLSHNNWASEIALSLAVLETESVTIIMYYGNSKRMDKLDHG